MSAAIILQVIAESKNPFSMFILEPSRKAWAYLGGRFTGLNPPK